MTVALTYALSGLQAASQRTAIRAGNIANVLTPGYRSIAVVQEAGPSGPVVSARPPVGVKATPVATAPRPLTTSFLDYPSDVSLERELVDLTMAKHAYKASAAVTRTVAEMQDAVLDMFV